jgi:DNA-binding XRE family transcriptional regulator
MLLIANIMPMLPNSHMPMRLINPKDLGALVREARTGNGMTQAQLGAKIGASRFWVAAFERGKSGAELGLALKAMRALKLVLTVEAEDVASRRQQAGTSIEQHPGHAASQAPSHPAVDLSSILKRSTKPVVASQQRDPFQIYSWNSTLDTTQESPAQRKTRSPTKRKRSR